MGSQTQDLKYLQWDDASLLDSWLLLWWWCMSGDRTILGSTLKELLLLASFPWRLNHSPALFMQKRHQYFISLRNTLDKTLHYSRLDGLEKCFYSSTDACRLQRKGFQRTHSYSKFRPQMILNESVQHSWKLMWKTFQWNTSTGTVIVLPYKTSGLNLQLIIIEPYLHCHITLSHMWTHREDST